MAKIVFTVPDTGTRFAINYLRRLGLVVTGLHTGKIDKIRDFTAPKLLITLRDPLVAFMSSYIRRPQRDEESALQMLETRIKDWAELEEVKNLYPFVTLRIDGPEGERESELKKVADFFGVDTVDFGWQVVGANNWAPTTIEMWDKVPWSKQTKEKIEKGLKPFRENYGYV